MRLLLDQGLPRSARRLLLEAGIDAIHVGDIGYSAADDATILQRAREEGRVVVTLDADFATLLALSGAISPSVIRIRIQGLYGREAAALIRSVLDHCMDELAAGAVVTVQPGRIRIRRLPLLP